MTLNSFLFKSFPLYPLYIWGPEWTCLYRNCISVFVVEWSKSTYLHCFFRFTLLIMDESRDNFLLSSYLRSTEFRLCHPQHNTSELTCSYYFLTVDCNSSVFLLKIARCMEMYCSLYFTILWSFKELERKWINVEQALS